MELRAKHARSYMSIFLFRIRIGPQMKRYFQVWFYCRTCGDRQPFTYIQDGVEGRWGNIRADGGEDCLADLSDVSAWLRQQGQQDVHHHLHPLRLLFLLGHGCRSRCILFVNLMSHSEGCELVLIIWCLSLCYGILKCIKQLILHLSWTPTHFASFSS